MEESRGGNIPTYLSSALHSPAADSPAGCGMKGPRAGAVHLEDRPVGTEQRGEEWKADLKEQSENIQDRFLQ